MRKASFCFAALLVLLSVPVFAQNYQYCLSQGFVRCEYLWDTPFSEGTDYWSYDSGSGPSYVSNPCGGGSTDAADLDPGDSVFQAFDTDDFTVWYIELSLYKTSTTVTANDWFKVQIYNYNTFQTENHYVYANSESDLCVGPTVINLSNDYANDTVRVLIQKGPSATATMYIDNVTFWGRN